MLNPQDRNLLLETLRPPAGYKLDHAIGCTFSLDLHALLTTPLAFTFFDWEDKSGNISSDPLALLESIRRHADKISIFCQAGQISVPRKQERIFAYLEQSVHEVLPPNPNGVFHPKVWVIRYTHDTEPIHYRFICLSRNLTFDKSWDTVLVLDGLLADRAYAYGINNPIGDFIRHLPLLALTSPSKETLNKIDQIDHEVRRVKFLPPPGIEEISFHPIGIPGGYKNFSFQPPKRRILVMSPFLSEHFLKNMVRRRQDCVLVSLPDSLEKINRETLQLYSQIFTLNREAESEEPDEEQTEQQSVPLLSGLHAKLFVMDDGWKANIWTGSANATNAAFNTNVEFLVRLRGRLVDLGINKLLNQEDKTTSFADLLEEYRIEEPSPLDTTHDNLEKRLREARLLLLSSSLFAEISPIEKTNEYQLEIKAEANNTPVLPTDIKVRCWPVTLNYSHSLPVDFSQNRSVCFSKVSLDALTAFFAYELECSDQGETLKERFVTKLNLVGEPDGRLEKLLRSLLKSKSQVLRLLLLLLADQSMPIDELIAIHRHLGNTGTALGEIGNKVPLLESLMKVLSQNPTKLDRINRLVDDLSKTEEGYDILPEGFMQIWEPIWQTRKEMPS